MKKKIAIVTVCALVTLISMTSTIFASQSTNSFKYKFWNKDPLWGTSYGVTYLSNIVGLNISRKIELGVKIKCESNNWSSWAWTVGDHDAKYTWSSLSVSKNSSSSNPRQSYHLAGISDGMGQPRTVSGLALNEVKEGTTYPDN